MTPPADDLDALETAATSPGRAGIDAPTRPATTAMAGVRTAELAAASEQSARLTGTPRLNAIDRLTRAMRSVEYPATGDAFLDLLRAVADSVVDSDARAAQPQGDRSVLWLVSRDGTRMRQIAPATAVGGWQPGSGPVAQVLGSRRPIELGLADGDSLGLQDRASARSTTDEDRHPNRSFGRFLPIRHGDRVGAVIGVVRAPGRPLFTADDRIVLDAAVERIEHAWSAQDLADSLSAERTRGITSTKTGGVVLNHSLLARLGRVAGDVVFRYLFNGLGMDFISEGVLDAIGYTAEELMSDPEMTDRIIHPDDRRILIDLIADPAEAERPLLVRFLRRNGQIAWQLLRLVTIRDLKGRIIGVEGFSTDVTTMKLAEAELAHQARSDALTGLSNRLNFREATARALARIARHPGTLAVLFLDLDGFKLVNDTLGHAAGDDVLRQVADRLRKVIRREDLVARLGGDEFAVLLAEIRDIGEASATAHRILESLEQPISVAGEIAKISSGVGIAIADDATIEADDLINRADVALYQAKRIGRGRWQVFDGPSGTLSGRVTPLDTPPAGQGVLFDEPLVPSESVLRASLAAGEFRVHYLPQIDASTGRMSSVEALVRWQHPELGLLPAAQFIDALGATDVIHPLGDWVLREACAHVAGWRSRFGADLKLWVNVSAKQLGRSGFVDTFMATLHATGLQSSLIGIELSDSTVAHLDSAREHAISQLQAAGVRIAMDAFGLGGSSLKTLHKLPLTQLKLDRSIVNELGRNGDDGNLLSIAVKFARTLGTRVVAVGVERPDQLERVRDAQCDEFQGHLTGRARPAEQFELLLGASRTEATIDLTAT